MKIFSSYIKEIKIAARGFYFYMEILMAVILLIIILFAIKDNPVSNSKEFLFYDMPKKTISALFADNVEKGIIKIDKPVTFKTKAVKFDVTNKETQKVTTYNFAKENIETDVFKMYDSTTGKLIKTIYLAKTKINLIRLAYGAKQIGVVISIDDKGTMTYTYYNQGYETDRLIKLLYVLHTKDSKNFEEAINNQKVINLNNIKTLTNKENMVPPVIVFNGALMGFFIVMAYIFLDKKEGVIRAFAVTPSTIWQYLISKILVMITTVIISASIITIPVMGKQLNYILFYIYLIVTTFAFASLGLLVASFYDNISKAFGALYIVMMSLMLPAFSYYIPSFNPIWLKVFPTYSMLQGFKEIIMTNGNKEYVIIYSIIYFASGVIILLLANLKFKKTLTV